METPDTNVEEEKVPPVTNQIYVIEENAPIHRDASWGAIISIVVILAMIVIGAFYAWGQRVAEQHHLPVTTVTPQTY